jgi:hypothetical protein
LNPKVSFDRTELWRAFRMLAVSSPVPAKKSVHRYTKLLRMELYPDGTVDLTTASLTSFTHYARLPMRWEGGAPTESPVVLCTVFDKFYAMVQGTARERIMATISSENRWIQVRCEGTARLPQEDPGNFPALPVWQNVFIEDYLVDDFAEAIIRVKGTICSDSSYSSIFGIFFDGNWVTCTGRYLTIHPSCYEWQGRVFASKELADLAPALNLYSDEAEEETFSMAICGNAFGIECGSVKHFVALQAAEFIDYRSIMAKVREGAVASVTMDVPALRAALARIAPFVGFWGALELTIREEELILEADNPSDSENYVESISHRGTTSANVIKILLRFEMVQQLAQNEDLVLHFKDGATPLYAASGETVTMLPPMRRT